MQRFTLEILLEVVYSCVTAPSPISFLGSVFAAAFPGSASGAAEGLTAHTAKSFCLKMCVVLVHGLWQTLCENGIYVFIYLKIFFSLLEIFFSLAPKIEQSFKDHWRSPGCD